jgi:hypothetical protein
MKLRFSIRDLLWLTLLCGVLAAWWMDRRGYGDPAIEFDKFSDQHDVFDFLHNRRTGEVWKKEGDDWISQIKRKPTQPVQPVQELQLDLE